MNVPNATRCTQISVNILIKCTRKLEKLNVKSVEKHFIWKVNLGDMNRMSTVTDFEWFYNAISNATFQSCTEDSSKILGAADTALDPLFCSYLQGKQQANSHGVV